VMNAVLSIYPERNWQPWKFSNIKVHSIWDDCKYDKDFIELLSANMGISNLCDWYRVSWSDLLKCRGAARFLNRRGGLVRALSGVYPNHPWDHKKFSNRQKKSAQWRLYKTVKDILPSNYEVIEEYVHPFLKFKTGCPMIFDIYVSSLNMVFEYQGHQHFHDHYMFGYVNYSRQRDNDRRETCKSVGMTIIEVPYWWQCDKATIESLIFSRE